MINVNLPRLVDSLSPTVKAALEQAVAMAANRGHEMVDIEHCLLQLCRDNNDLTALLCRLNVDSKVLEHQLTMQLRQLTISSPRAPTLSLELVDAFKSALLLALLDHRRTVITSAHFLAALLIDEKLRQRLLMSAVVLRNLPADTVRAMLNGNKDSVEIASADAGNINLNADATAQNGGNIQLANHASALARYTSDLTQRARDGLIDPVTGRDAEISQCIDILSRRRQNNPILIGDAGVGKTAVAEGLALRIVAGDAPLSLRDVAIHSLDMGLLQAGASVRGEFEQRLQQVITDVKNAPRPIILFIDEAHTLIGAGGSQGLGDAANLLKPALARGELRTIAATTWSEYKKYFERDSALARRFQPISVEEPDDATAIEMMRSIVPALARHHGVSVDEDAIVASVKLSRRYITARQLPDKSISLLDTACARAALEQARTASPVRVDGDAVADVVCNWTGIPVGKMLSDDVAPILDLAARLRKRIKGQDHVLDGIARMIHISRAGLNDPRKPVGVLLLIGNSGVGKTETALALADVLYGGEHNLTAINMAEFKEEHKISMLLGAPPGYVGFGEGGVLTEAARRKPYSVILLDEIEKAHAGVQDIFYNLFDKGSIKDGEGRNIDFRNTLIVMTTNAGDQRLQALMSKQFERPNQSELLEQLRPDLLRHFRAAFLGRCTPLVYFPLLEPQLKQISELNLQRIARRLREHYDASFDYDDATLTQLVAYSRHADTGARHIEHVVAHTLLPKLATICLQKIAAGVPIRHASLRTDAAGEFQFVVQSENQQAHRLQSRTDALA